MDASNLLTSRARLTPDKEALLELETGSRYTYAALNGRANRAANWLQTIGVGCGDRVSILAHNSIVYLDLFYGCAKIGAIFAPLNWRLAVPELVYIVNDCTPRLLLVGPEFAAIAQEMQPQITVDHMVTLASYGERLSTQSDAEPARPAELNGESAHCILYTSGTTGRPKGAIIPQRQVVWNCINTAVSWELSAHDVSPIFTPLFHAGGLFAFMTPLLYLGGRIILAKEFDAAETLRVISQEKCTVILGVPTLFQMWLKSPQFATADFSQVHFFISGGAPCPPTLIEAWRTAKGVTFRQGYGLTEVGPNCFSMSDAESTPKTGSVGKPVFHSEMRLVDADGRDAPIGATGELLIRGPHVCSGYWQNPAATAQALRNGWFYTGDMARVDEDGFFSIAGRFKDMIISGGENVYAAEVEAAFLEHPGVAECALIGQPDEQWGEVGLMVVVTAVTQSPTADELIQFCAAKLARYKIPRHIIFTDALPYSPYGKVMKAELREKYLVSVTGNP
jgi:fatty-acyl-CoA synthase